MTLRNKLLNKTNHPKEINYLPSKPSGRSKKFCFQKCQNRIKLYLGPHLSVCHSLRFELGPSLPPRHLADSGQRQSDWGSQLRQPLLPELSSLLLPPQILGHHHSSCCCSSRAQSSCSRLESFSLRRRLSHFMMDRLLSLTKSAALESRPTTACSKDIEPDNFPWCNAHILGAF